jgi:uncharacterized protein YbjT (DUF2867 family)
MTILVIGGTGTLGRQIVKELLDNGYDVRCLVRNIKKASFLKEWGATLAYGDLKLPETIPKNFKGIKAVIDASTLRLDDNVAKIEEIDLLGKLCLLKAAKSANIQNFIFFSITENDDYRSILLMKFKSKIENILKSSEISYSVFQLSGFYQGLILQYAIPILEKEEIFTTDDLNSYIDSQDVAKICVKFLNKNSKLEKKKTIELKGQKNWKSNEIVKICEELAGQKANAKKSSFLLISIFKKIIGFGKWGWVIQDRLSFNQIISNKRNIENVRNLEYTAAENLVYKSDLLPLEYYLQEYFESMLKKLKTLNYDKNQNVKRKELIF